MKFRIRIVQDEDGKFIAECPSLPGCISEGNTRQEAWENIQDAIRGYLESLKKHNEHIPPSIEEEIVDINDYLGENLLPQKTVANKTPEEVT